MVSLSYDPQRRLPTAEELPDSDDTPVDNELQNDIPNFLLNILRMIWSNRQDWYWGVDMGIYCDPDKRTPTIIPDGFLALGVVRRKSEQGRLSYVLWEEQYTMPILAMEVVSQKYNSEYEDKLQQYQDLGILYYVIYNPLRRIRGRHKHRQPLEVYKLIAGKYQKITDATGIFWMPEIGLGIGCEHRSHGGWLREWVYWYNQSGIRYLTAEERIEAAEANAEHERQERVNSGAIAARMAAKLRELGINPDDLQES
jgi:Uma2 family endonuclease